METSSVNEVLVDTAKEWIEERGGAYLAKENIITYYTTFTGRKSDLQWVSLSLAEVVRTIAAMKLGATGEKLTQRHIITACQELGRVYQQGVRSRHTTSPEIFNYLSETESDIADTAMLLLAQEIQDAGYRAVLYADVREVYRSIDNLLKIGATSRQVSDLMHKHFPLLGYQVRVDQFRPQVRGKKQSAIMMPNSAPKEIVDLAPGDVQSIKHRIHGALK